MEDSPHHVHFDEAVINDEMHENCLIYQVAPDGTSLTVHLGFLQIKHRYRIELNVPAQLLRTAGFDVGANSAFVGQDIQIPNLHCKLVDFCSQTVAVKGEDNFVMVIEFFAHKEKLLKERLHLCGKEETARTLELVLVARVLGRGKGTPMLRNGIHCIGVEKDEDESELSDWQGFAAAK
ncbi:adipose-secreted signaling protein [Anopheles bellator]|uniref:adipose-secreted signaling protein n=1 Tax=Anopheles bellator TaxID=139047 RepID=UPI002648B0C9|nr:adipose-secreted signaling protein [Anopheles bellator]